MNKYSNDNSLMGYILLNMPIIAILIFIAVIVYIDRREYNEQVKWPHSFIEDHEHTYKHDTLNCNYCKQKQ